MARAGSSQSHYFNYGPNMAFKFPDMTECPMNELLPFTRKHRKASLVFLFDQRPVLDN